MTVKRKILATAVLVGVLLSQVGGLSVFATATTYDFSDGSDYTYDSSKIEVAGGQAQLKATSSPAWYSASWTKRKPVSIDNTSTSTTLTNYQVLVEVTYDADMQADFDDVRFTSDDGTTLIDFWLEAKTNSSTATFWVEVPEIAGSAVETIYVYYGNAAATSASNGDNTFLLFDDFTSTANTVDVDEFTTIGQYSSNPILSVGDSSASDRYIREMGNILYEPDGGERKYKMMYTGYRLGSNTDEKVHYAYSEDGITWTKYASNPVISTRSEDPYVVKVGSTYYLFAEDKAGGATAIKRWESTDFQTWTNGTTVFSPTGSGWESNDVSSPVVYIENGVWHLFYEGRNASHTLNGIGLATSSDGVTWSRSPANPVIDKTDTAWVTGHVVPDDITKHGSTYYFTYHGELASGIWDSGIASSSNLTVWNDYGTNPIETDNEIAQLATVHFLRDGDGQLKFYYYGYEGTSSLADSFGIYRGLPTVYSGALNTSKWTSTKKGNTHAVVALQDGVLRLAGVPGVVSSANVRSSSTFTNDIAIEIRKRSTNQNYRNIALGSGSIVDISGGSANWYTTTLASGYMALSQSTGFLVRMPASGAFAQIGSTFNPGSSTSYERHKLSYTSAGVLRWHVDGVLKDVATSTTFISNAKSLLITQGEFSDGRGGSQDVDWVFVRKQISPEPSVTFGSEQNAYASDDPTIEPAVALAFESLEGFSVTSTTNGGSLRYQISNDGGSTWYWYDSGWNTTSAGYAEANTAGDINSHLGTFPVGDGQFLWRAYLRSDGTQLVQISEIVLTSDTVEEDSTPPERTGGEPSGTLAAGTDTTDLELTTDEAAMCKYGESPGTAYVDLTNSFGATSTTHSVAVSGLIDGASYSYYVRCQDELGNTNTTDYEIEFSVAAPDEEPEEEPPTEETHSSGRSSRPALKVPQGGFTAVANTLPGEGLSLKFNYGSNTKKIIISPNKNFDPRYSFSATSTLPWRATSTEPFYVKFCTSRNKCSKPIEVRAPEDKVALPNFVFNRDLYLGMIGDDVLALQKLLNASGFIVSLSGPGSVGNETRLFGSLTKAALIKFQEEYSDAILKPAGLLRGTGYFGPSTRNFILQLLK